LGAEVEIMKANNGGVSTNIEGQSGLDEAMQRGIAASEAGDKEGAYAIFRQVIEEHPGALEPWVWLGWSSQHMTEAEAAFKRALEIDPTNEDAHMGMKWVDSERGTADQDTSSETAATGPRNSGELVAGTSDSPSSGSPESLPAIEDVEGETRSLDDLMQLGIATAQAGDKATANVTFQSVVERYPDVPEAWVWLAGTTTNLEEAEHAFKKAAELDPSNNEAQLGLRWVALRRSVSSTGGSSNVTNPNLKAYDTDMLSQKDMPAQANETSAVLQFLKQPVFIIGVFILMALLVIAWFLLRS